MKKILNFLAGAAVCLTVSVLFCSSSSGDETRDVYICTGPKALAYHYNDHCHLMVKNCTGDIKKISLKKAKNMDRKPCGKCAKGGKR